MNIVYTQEAIEDLVRLREFIATNNPLAAGRIAAALLEGIERLRDFPEMGHPVALAPDPGSVRDLVIGDHVVRYIPRPDVVIILRLWHQYEQRPRGSQRPGGQE